MKYVKQPKKHIILDDFEWRAWSRGSTNIGNR